MYKDFVSLLYSCTMVQPIIGGQESEGNCGRFFETHLFRFPDNEGGIYSHVAAQASFCGRTSKHFISYIEISDFTALRHNPPGALEPEGNIRSAPDSYVLLILP